MNDIKFFEIPYRLLEKKRVGLVSVYGRDREESIKIAKEDIEKTHPYLNYEIDSAEIREVEVKDGVFHDWWWSFQGGGV